MVTKKARGSAPGYNPYALNEIEEFIIEVGSDDVATFGGKFEGGVHCQQVPSEFSPCILTLLESGKTIKSYLEVGAAAGGSAFIMAYYFHPELIVLVDNDYHRKVYLRAQVLADIPHEEIIGNSHDPTIAERVAAFGPFDAIMLDGDHIYEGVLADVETYGELLSPDGFLIFHDSKVGPPHGCARVFEDLKQDARWVLINEFVSPTRPICGIGLFQKAVK